MRKSTENKTLYSQVFIFLSKVTALHLQVLQGELLFITISLSKLYLYTVLEDCKRISILYTKCQSYEYITFNLVSYICL